MTTTDGLVERLREALDKEAAIALFRGAIGRESITGNEANVVSYLAEAMQSLGLDGLTTAEFRPGRPNVWAERKGTGSGPRLLFIGHTDTVHVDGWREHWAGTEREDPFAAPIIDGAVWGRGSGDLKAGICSSLSALSLLDRAGVKLAGDIAFAFVGDEESGQPGTGVSAGIKDLVTRIETGEIARPDFVVYVEPTRLSVYPAQIGFFITDITITGKSAYFGVPELGKDALRASHAAMSALWAHSDEIAARAEHKLIGRSFLLITGLAGGGYIAVPERCTLSLIRKLLPGESLDKAAAEIEAAVRSAITDPEIAVEFSYPAGRDHQLGGTAAEIDETAAEVGALSTAMAEAMVGRGVIEGAPFWSETPFFVNRLGIPAVYCAPGDIRNCHTYEERVEVEEYLAGVVGFAAFMARYCGVVD
ncbi:M20/M25/M40 family metallo-hydrolase [Ensifer adhaerens]|uniref:M20 family metallopeptidase n=1 Tax=Ensifer adhaerens TaxID=106592 RepID=UPI001CBFC8A0|nr:M20/M25/M40 family metallo-hydrolase [Ensifer adhaerens]MBZ7922967.1 M20/M25/M40 family metallo-hydrolase [Ensifer adhaerens]UAX91564.1 M20/M25/M40 family metallo-hydrolase [Ensifer adhaerens]UAX99192.1 M20/M25/M40 family metallo-hydrolase [Ensifer adhaerens]UAY06575.1 M20/M25/M40 family metallo-hydrolase [Ensifer adhaerens]